MQIIILNLVNIEEKFGYLGLQEGIVEWEHQWQLQKPNIETITSIEFARWTINIWKGCVDKIQLNTRVYLSDI